jgi:uncharacterized protein YdeI (YjbR/CyaY-like superfamily)
VKPVFFRTPSELRSWLEQHHDDAAELLVGFHKRASGKPSITWPEAVDEALCFGWIDGVRKGIDDASYTIRFTPRKPSSNWSLRNIERVAELTAQGLMRPAGLAAFEARREEKSGIYSHEQRRAAKLDAAQERHFRDNAKAWDFFEAQPPSYRRAAVWWVVSAKREETRLRRLATLIEDSERGRTVKPLTRR